MRILVLHDPYKPIENGSVGGEDNLVQLEIEQLSLRGNNVIDGRFFDAGTRKKLNQLRAQSYGSTPDVLSIIKDSKPDVIHTHNLSQRSGYTWMSKTGLPIVSSIHNYRLFCASSIAWRNGENCFECRDKSATSAIKHRCDGARGTINASRQLFFQASNPQIHAPKLFLTASEMMNHALSPIVAMSKMRILRNPGISAQEFSNESKPRKGWLFAGRFVEEKGILDLIRSWPSGESLDLAGSGPLAEKISEQIENCPNIKMIGTFPPGTLDIYYGYEGLVFPSTWLEGSPLVIADSLSAGTPVITLDVSASREQVELSQAGVVIKGALSVFKIQEAIQNVRSHSESYSRNALRASKSIFSIHEWSLKLEEYLFEAAAL